MQPVQRQGRRTAGLRPTGLAAAFASGGHFLPATLSSSGAAAVASAQAAGAGGLRSGATYAHDAAALLGVLPGAFLGEGSVASMTLTSPSAGSAPLQLPVAKEPRKLRPIAGIIPNAAAGVPLLSPDAGAAGLSAGAVLMAKLLPPAPAESFGLLPEPLFKPDPGFALPQASSAAAPPPQHAFQPVVLAQPVQLRIPSSKQLASPAASAASAAPSAAASPPPGAAALSLPSTPPPQLMPSLSRSTSAATSGAASASSSGGGAGAGGGGYDQLGGLGSPSGSVAGAAYGSGGGAAGLAGMANSPGMVSRYRGVSCISGGYGGQRFKATVNHRGVAIELGPFESEEDAARAYDSKARELHGERARLNFPDTAAGERTRMGRSAYRGISWQVRRRLRLWPDDRRAASLIACI